MNENFKLKNNSQCIEDFKLNNLNLPKENEIEFFSDEGKQKIDWVFKVGTIKKFSRLKSAFNEEWILISSKHLNTLINKPKLCAFL